MSVFEGKHSYTMASVCVLRENGFSIEWFQKQYDIFQNLLSKLDH
jgi:hypothetical protein